MAFEIREQNDKYAIFKGDKQITEWFDWIGDYGLVEGQSNYFAAKEDGIYSIYHKLLNKKISYTDKFEDYNQNKELNKLPLLDDECQ